MVGSSGKKRPGPEGGRRPTGGPGRGASDRGRWSSKRKLEAVLRVLKGEDLDSLSRELGVSAEVFMRTLVGQKKCGFLKEVGLR